MQLPKDPFMLYSVVNMKLRDEYPDFETLCRSMDADPEEIKTKLAQAGFEYDPTTNQFR